MNEGNMELLQPGVVIKPIFDPNRLPSLCLNLYGIRVLEVKQLDGYDDKNFWIKKIHNISNPFIKEIWKDGYVLKILNSIDSKDTSFIEGQNALMLHLGKHAFRTPQPIRNLEGNYYSNERFDDDGTNNSPVHIVRLLTFQEGELLKNVKLDATLSMKLGNFLYKIDSCLQTFDHPSFKTHSSIWRLEHAPKILEFIHYVKCEQRKSLVLKTIREFEERVLPLMGTLEKGIIHGDFNEQNIIISQTDGIGLLDFGDSHFGPYLFEVSLGLCYLLLLSNDITQGKRFLEGYYKDKLITQLERKLLKVCVNARLCQSLVLGLYSHSQDPLNEYLLSTQTTGWPLLTTLNNAPDDIFS